MRLLYKQLTKEVLRNKVFVWLLFLLVFLSELSFYFVKFSIDGNAAVLESLPVLSANQLQYKNALASNTSLAYTFFFSMLGLACFVFFMFFYHFFGSNAKNFGCLKALGFTDRSLCFYFVLFTAGVSFAGSLIGLAGGYFLSDILVMANKRTYSVTGLIKGVAPFSMVVGFLGAAAILCLNAFLCYFFVRGKEPGALIAGRKRSGVRKTLLIADGIVKLLPVKNKFPLRIALRKPLAVFLIFGAVTAFNVCIILGQSLNFSSQKVFDSQMLGHNYDFDTRYPAYMGELLPFDGLPYLYHEAGLMAGGYEIEQTIIGLYHLNEVYELQDMDMKPLPLPEAGSIYINPGLAEVYGVRKGDSLSVFIDGRKYIFAVAGVAANAKAESILANAAQLAEIMGIPEGTYNGVWSMEKPAGGITTDREQRILRLEKDAVSNNTSSVINQVIGGIIGGILLFLAIYVNFQDNKQDMVILNLMGHSPKGIRRMLIDIYRPILWAVFFLTIVPSIYIVKFIQRSLSVSIKDYIPFGTNAAVIVLIFISLNIIYSVGQSVLFSIIGKTSPGKS
ncbi:FtsX-like permease family protein [Kineothrix alysoides]|uniref:FtsX-like permease family protein n=1 Tax=Kineothrix alysoides TaxID=1469948 RepID=A0A4R1QUB5_9FIRM|nr:ABC transporter permease [Kineothrix alysoides]TCL57546.1 FtsX-like permease family protein [Kineothrix alysoides]